MDTTCGLGPHNKLRQRIVNSGHNMWTWTSQQAEAKDSKQWRRLEAKDTDGYLKVPSQFDSFASLISN